MLLAGNQSGPEIGQIRVIRSTVSVWTGLDGGCVDIAGHVVQEYKYIDFDDDTEHLKWVDVCPLCDAVMCGCSHGFSPELIALGEIERASFDSMYFRGIS